MTDGLTRPRRHFEAVAEKLRNFLFMSTNHKCLMVVESPSKCKTLKKFLGKDFEVLASYGHIRDLPSRQNAIDTENDFAANYEDIDRNIKHVNEIARQMKKSQILYLATDPDREGEAIAGHLVEILNERGLLKNKSVHRIIFSEINEAAVKYAIAHPRDLSTDLLNAQRTRRILDHLFGFTLSPLLWKKIHSGLSAGRVQSPALRLISEREAEIESFQVREYWSIEALWRHENDKTLSARLVEFDGEKLQKFSISSGDQAKEMCRRIEKDSQKCLTVSQRTSATKRLKPPPPYITSTLLQDASNKLGFDQKRTMRVAQNLYEGVMVDGNSISLITYMRTDSFNISNSAIKQIRETIDKIYSEKFLPEKPRFYQKKSKTAQEAHEAIRPTDPGLLPSILSSKKIGSDEMRLYALVWARAISAQMNDAISENNKIFLTAGAGHVFQLSGTRIVFPGHLSVNNERRFAYKIGDFGSDNGNDSKQASLPNLQIGDKLKLLETVPHQHFTKPPPRYTVATLIATLDDFGIGRPSTYAAIVSILEQRRYIEIDKRFFHPTDIGSTVNKFLVSHFNRYVDYEFTAGLEKKLDRIANGDEDWHQFLDSFWEVFTNQVSKIDETVERSSSINERVLGTDPDSGRQVSVRVGRFGPYAQIGVKEDEEKPKFASIPPHIKMNSIDLQQALTLFQLPRQIGVTEKGEEIVVAIGRFGPYIRFGDRFASLAKEDDPYTIGLERAKELIAKRIELDNKRKVKSFDDDNIRVLRSRFGFTVVSGTKKKNLPKSFDVESLTRDDCLEMLENMSNEGKGGSSNGKTRTKKAVVKTTRKTTIRRAGEKLSGDRA